MVQEDPWMRFFCIFFCISLCFACDAAPEKSLNFPPSPSHTLNPLPIPTNSPNNPPSSSPPLNHHPMQTCSRNSIIKPNPKYGLTTIIPTITEPYIISQAPQDPKWVQVMQEDYDALIRNNNWALVPSRPG